MSLGKTLALVGVVMTMALAFAGVPAGAQAAATATASQSAACPTAPEEGPSTYACDVVGSNHMTATYGFGTECSLEEGAHRLLGMGSRVIKVSLWDAANRYRFGACNWAGVTTATPPAAIAASPDFRQLFAMPFTTYVMQAFSTLGPDPNYWNQGVSDAQCYQESTQMYDLARQLLVTYGATRKEFVVQNWESDWGARNGFDPNVIPSATAIEGLVRWYNCRQDGLERARTTIPSGARVLQGCEVNLVDRAVQGLPGTVIDAVIPRTHCDLVSYSAWDTLSYAMAGETERGRAKFRAALDHIAAKTPDPSPYVRAAICPAAQNVYVGEYGTPENEFGATATMATIKMATEESLRWGARYALYWQLYDNELRKPVSGRPTDADVRGYWLTKPSGILAPAGTYLSSLLQTPGPGSAPCPPPPPPPPPPAPIPGDRQPPRVRHIRLIDHRLSLRVSEPATVRAAIARRVGHGANERWRTVARPMMRSPHAGPVAARLHRLRPGAYRVTIRARDRAGNSSSPVRHHARIHR